MYTSIVAFNLKVKFIGLIFFLFIFNYHLLSQIKLDTALIRHKELDESRDIYFFDTLHNLSPLAFSKNQIEIRLISVYMPLGGFEKRIVSYNGSNWTAFVLENNYKTYDKSLKKSILKKTNLRPKRSFQNFISKLEEASLFTISSQNELVLDSAISVFDGVSYVILYKVGNRFRHIRFNNPDIYKKVYPNTKEFRKYISLIKLFLTELSLE